MVKVGFCPLASVSQHFVRKIDYRKSLSQLSRRIHQMRTGGHRVTHRLGFLGQEKRKWQVRIIVEGDIGCAVIMGTPEFFHEPRFFYLACTTDDQGFLRFDCFHVFKDVIANRSMGATFVYTCQSSKMLIDDDQVLSRFRINNLA